MKDNIDLNTVDVQKTASNYNHKEQWKDVKISATMVEVPWDAHNKKIVKFKNPAKRLEWFASRELKVEMEDMEFMKGLEVFSNTFGHNGQITVPLTYDSAYGFNYVHVTQEALPVPNNAQGAPERSEFFYFIKGIEAISPNTTRLTIELDTWMTFMFDVHVGPSLLERGHYGMKKGPSVREYLSNPIEKIDKIGYEEPFNVEPSIVKDGNSFSLYDGSTMYAVIYSTQSLYYDDLEAQDWVEGNRASAVTKGYHVNQYGETNDSGIVFSLSMETAPNSVHYNVLSGNGSNVKNGVDAFYTTAINVKMYAQFLTRVKQRHPQAFKSIQVIALLPENLLTLRGERGFLGESVYTSVVDASDMASIYIDETMFNFKKEYKDLTKLYTSPYSSVVFYDAKGKAVEVRTQDISNKISAKTLLSTLLPTLNVKAMITGVGGSTVNQYTFLDLNGSKRNGTFENSMWKDLVFDFDIPTIAAFGNTVETNLELRNKISEIEAKISKSRIEAEADKVIVTANEENSKLINNGQAATDKWLIAHYKPIFRRWAYDKAKFDIDDNYKKVAFDQKQVDEGAKVTKTLRNDSISSNINTNKSLFKVKSDMIADSLEVNKQAARDVYDIQHELTYNIIRTNYSMGGFVGKMLGSGSVSVPYPTISHASAKSADTDEGGTKTTDDNGINPIMVQIVPTSPNGSDGSSATTMSTQGVTKPSAGGSWLDKLIAGTADFTMGEKYDSIIANLQSKASDQVNAVGFRERGAINEISIGRGATELSLNNNNARRQQIIQNAATDGNAIITKTNIKYSGDLARKLANRSREYKYDVDGLSMDESYDTVGRKNENRILDIEGNATVNRTVAEGQSDSEVGNLQFELNRLNAQLATNEAHQVGELNDKFMAKFGLMTVFYNVKTLDRNKEREVGDFFLKYGYAYPTEVINPDLLVMSKFSYWKFSDIVIVGESINESNKSILRNMFMEGVTIYGDPDDINKASIYDNEVI